MKKLISSVLAFALLLAMAGCNSKKKEEEKKPEQTIEITEMREIAELATVDCYFHNVAKSDRERNPEWY
jgi:PBP1b-binding outer membrane lipoprotein LpoB